MQLLTMKAHIKYLSEKLIKKKLCIYLPEAGHKEPPK